MLPFEVILEESHFCTVIQTNKDRLAPAYNTQCRDNKWHSLGPNMLHYMKAVTLRKRYNIGANIHQDESSSLYGDTTSVRACITTRRHVNKHGRRKYNLRATPVVTTFLIPIVMTMGNNDNPNYCRYSIFTCLYQRRNKYSW